MQGQRAGSPHAYPLIGFGQVRHTRLQPAHHAFVYGTFFVMLPMRSLQQDFAADPTACPLALNRFAAISFFDKDHGDGRNADQGGALGWIESLLQQEGITDANGEIWLHCYPRVWGFTFKPVSFWYCHRTDGSLRAIVAEVNNTFGERHCYLLDHPALGAEQQADKVFHVSPFCPVEGRYRFRFMVNADRTRTVARVDYDDANGPLIQTSVSGDLEPITANSLRRAMWGYPAMTLAVVARIHWQALRLFIKKVPFFSKPHPPSSFLTR
jgi:uncharacterized protein